MRLAGLKAAIVNVCCFCYTAAEKVRGGEVFLFEFIKTLLTAATSALVEVRSQKFA